MGEEKEKEKKAKGLDGTRFVQGREREGNDEVSKALGQVRSPESVNQCSPLRREGLLSRACVQ